MERETLQKLAKSILKRIAHVEFTGVEHIPPEGGLLVATNHMSRVDALLLLVNPVREDITALVADKYKKYPLFNFILETAKVIWLDRDKADFAAFRLAAEALKRGICLGIAPEGTRSQTGTLLEGKPGTVLLALKTGVPIVPVGIAGSDSFFRELLRLRKPRVRLNFGEPIRVPPLDRDNRDEAMQYWTDEIMIRIAALLPEKYWGVYKDHPRVRELGSMERTSVPLI